MQFIGDFSIDAGICERLIELHQVCDRQGGVQPGRLYNRDKGGLVVDARMKDSFDLPVFSIPEDLQRSHDVPLYIGELQRCADEYLARFPHLRASTNFNVTETPIIQHYRPGGGFKVEHFERSNLKTSSRLLVWMTYLNDVTDAGGTRFVYQDATFEARRGRTLIWPSDFTHTHAGVVSPTQHKYIITGWFNLVA